MVFAAEEDRNEADQIPKSGKKKSSQEGISFKTKV